MAVACYFSLGDLVSDNIVMSMSGGWERVLVEVMLLVHLITTFPIIMNPPSQIMEQMMNIPTGMIILKILILTISLQISIGKDVLSEPFLSLCFFSLQNQCHLLDQF